MLNTKPGKEKEYSDWFDKNTDSYSRRCFTFAEGWAEKIEDEISKMPPHASVIDIITECADRTAREEDTDGITGFMYGCACSILEQEWKYGDEFKQWRENERNK